MKTHSICCLIGFAAIALSPADLRAHATVDIGITLRAPEAVAASSSFVLTTELTDYAHDNGAAIIVKYKFPPGVQQPKALKTGVWNCEPFSGAFTCSAELIPPGISTITFNVVAPATAGSVDIQAANDLSIANFDPYTRNNTASARIKIYDPKGCITQAPAIAGPADGTSLAGGHVTLSWTPVTGAAYRIWTAVEGAAPHLLVETSSTELNADVPIGSTEWWVDAFFDLCPTTTSSHSHFVSNGVASQWSVADFAGRPGVSGTNDGPAGQATFETPSSLGADIYGGVLVLDSEASTIRSIAADGTISTLAGQSGRTGSLDSTQSFSLLNHPEAIAVAPGGFGYVADSGNDLIRQYFPTGDGIATFTPALATVAGSAGVAGSKDGQGTSARFDAPAGVAVAPDFTVFVSDTGANRIRKVSPAGVVTSLSASSIPGFNDGNAATALFDRPTGLAVDRGGNLFVADSGNHVIRRIATDGTINTFAGAPGIRGFVDGAPGVAMFDQPTALAFDALGNLYVADTGNNAIRQIAPSGFVSTVIGNGPSGHLNGTSANALLNAPTGLAIDASGRILIADSGNHVVRVATAAAQPAAPAEPKPRRRVATH